MLTIRSVIKNLKFPNHVFYVDMKLGTVTKLDKRNKIMSKKIGDNTVSENFDVITIFLIYSQFGSIWIQFG